MKGWTKETLAKKKAAGTIKGFTEAEGKRPALPAEVKPKSDAGRANKEWIYETLKSWCEERGYLLIRELFFSEERDWRLDWVVFDGTRKVLGVEYNGIMSKKSRHTTIKGYTGDMDKLNAAQLEGWKVLQFTPLNYKNLIDELKKL